MAQADKCPFHSEIPEQHQEPFKNLYLNVQSEATAPRSAWSTLLAMQ